MLVTTTHHSRCQEQHPGTHRPIRGTTDCQKYQAIADLPADAQSIFPGITMNGRGRIWIDDVHTEVVNP